MYDTRNDLPPATHAKVIELLAVRLADAADLLTGLSRATDRQPSFLEAPLHATH
jgi:uncharacterized protein YbjT (DUF2867 family)